MAFWVLILLPMVVLAESRPANAINQTDLHRAMADMRSRSYHGFVILLNILNTIPNPLQRSAKTTFLMPHGWQLSAATLTRSSLQDFILRHSIPSGFTLDELKRLPNRTLVPSGIPKRMISITRSRRSGLFLNKARITTPNVCLGPNIRCHGISSQIGYNDAIDYNPASQPLSLQNMKLRVSQTRSRVKSSGATSQNRTAQIH